MERRRGKEETERREVGRGKDKEEEGRRRREADSKVEWH
jgi:hypothetical protein